MAIEVIERVHSRESTTGKSATVDLKYIITGTSDDIAAKAVLATSSPLEYDGLVRQSRHITPVGDPTETLTWEGSVRYGARTLSEEDLSSYSFDTSGGSQHITQSLATQGQYATSGQTAPDYHGAIGVSGESVDGTEITVPVYNFSETHYLDPTVVTEAYKGTVFSMTGKVNSDTFRGFSPGEVLFLGAAGTRRGTGSDDDWEITYRFAASPNKTGLTVGDIGGISKKGWERGAPAGKIAKYAELSTPRTRRVLTQECHPALPGGCATPTTWMIRPWRLSRRRSRCTLRRSMTTRRSPAWGFDVVSASHGFSDIHIRKCRER